MRVTRASAARAAGRTLVDENSEDVKASSKSSTAPAISSPTKRIKAQATKPANHTPSAVEAGKSSELRTSVRSRKRKRAASLKPEEDINELPHNLGKSYSAAEGKVEDEVKMITTNGAGPQETLQVEMKQELSVDAGKDAKIPARTRGRARALLEDPAVAEIANKLAEDAEVSTTTRSPRKRKAGAKANPYGLTPGETPYPDWPHPTPEECQVVNDLLAKVHGEVKAPAKVPAPSTTVSGCGEVPSILDALIRTLLSAATTGTNSSRAFKGLVDKFGILQEGIGKGSVDWDRVRRADIKEVFGAIKSGGLADTKSKRIKEILDMVYHENLARREALLKSEETNGAPGPPGAEGESKAEKQKEISRAEQHVLSLDHLHVLSSDDALNALIKYPGIGPKTASCVLLFCMQRPSFAVDTHVFRLCKWLNWIPDKATRNTAYSHCEVRVPDHLKYPLHQLLIRHGKTCPRCRAATREGNEDWDKGCPIDHLVKRTGKEKRTRDAQSKNAGKQSGKKRKNATSSEDGMDSASEGAGGTSGSDSEDGATEDGKSLADDDETN